MVCHYCGTAYEIPQQCPQCEDTELRDIGYGTEKIETAVQACFPQARVARMDLDTTRSRSAYEKIISDFQQGETNLLIGTQMVTKGLDFDRVRVVGILNADQMLSQPDYRAYERAFQMMSQVAGRAGRRGKRGLVILQTRQPQHPIISQVVNNDYRAMYLSQMAERRAFLYPPFVRLFCITLKHRDESTCQLAAQNLAQLLRPHFPGPALLGPDRPSVGRIQSLHIRRILLKADPQLPPAGIRRILWAARTVILSMEAYKQVNIFFDVDP
jgi:primosomal protein N' (replication factor Y)